MSSMLAFAPTAGTLKDVNTFKNVFKVLKVIMDTSRSQTIVDLNPNMKEFYEKVIQHIMYLCYICKIT